MYRAYKYRVYVSIDQSREMAAMLETHRRLYNACLEQRIAGYATTGELVKYTDQSAWFKAERTRNPYYARLNFNSAQATMLRLGRAFGAFFRRAKAGQSPGFPRFKAVGQFTSITFPFHGNGIRLKGNRLRVQHVGVLRVKVHRPHEGRIKTVTLQQDGDKWFLILACDLGDVAPPPKDGPAVGIDVGLEYFLTTSDGGHVPNPRFLKGQLPELRRRRRAMYRKAKGGTNRRKSQARVARLHARVRNLRREFHHQTALSLVRRHGLVAVESLNIAGMLRNHRLARAIADAGWAGFLLTLRHKAERAGVAFVEVDCRGTSQECSGCGARVPKSLSQRWHTCPRCGLSLQRDVNAARNILARAGPAGAQPVGLNSDGGVFQEADRS